MDTRQTAFENDQRLMEMVSYHETKGMIKSIENLEQLTDRFAEFKMLIKRGSFTIDELEKRVFSNHGIMTPIPKLPINIQEMLFQTEKMAKDFQNRDNDNENGKKNKNKNK